MHSVRYFKCSGHTFFAMRGWGGWAERFSGGGGLSIFSQVSKGGCSVFREVGRGGHLFFRKKISKLNAL